MSNSLSPQVQSAVAEYLSIGDMKTALLIILLSLNSEAASGYASNWKTSVSESPVTESMTRLMLAWAQDEQMSLNIRESALRVLGHAEELEADLLTGLAELAQIGSYQSDLGYLSVTAYETLKRVVSV